MMISRQINYKVRQRKKRRGLDDGGAVKYTVSHQLGVYCTDFSPDLLFLDPKKTNHYAPTIQRLILYFMPAQVGPAQQHLHTTETNLQEESQTNIQRQNQPSINTPPKRKSQSLLVYFPVCLMELVTIFLSLLLILLSPNELYKAYLTYIVMTCVRCLVFITSTLLLVGLSKEMFKLYFLLDNVVLVEIASDITYAFLNYRKEVNYIMGAITCYPILLFFLCGNGRVMLAYCDWKPWQVIFYKSLKLVGSTYFLVYGCYLLINGNLAQDQKQIFLLWVFTTCAFWAQMCFQVNTKDQSDNLNTNYVLLDIDE